MTRSRTSAVRSDLQRAHLFAQEKLAEQFRNLLLEVEGFSEQIEWRITDLHEAGSRYASSVAGMKHLRDSLTKFHRFAFRYFAYIQEGNPSNLYNQRLALIKIQNEMLPLRPLLDQRRVPRSPEQRRDPGLLEYLQLADRLAWDFLDKCGLLEKPVFYNRRPTSEPTGEIESILVYFEEEALIRQGYDAYERVPSICLPTSTWCSPWLWLSMAHEVGHYIYHKLAPPGYTEKVKRPGDQRPHDPRKNELSLTLQERVRNALAQKGASDAVQKVWGQWLEELFADLYGVLVLGPAYTESYICQWLLPKLVRGHSGHLLESDGVHPPDLLRPFVQLELLRQQVGLGQDRQELSETEQLLAAEIDRLERLWRGACAELTPADQQERFAGDLFAFWLTQRIGGLRVRVRRCLEQFVPAIATALLEMLEDYRRLDQVKIKVYDGDTHAAVQLVASSLAPRPAAVPSVQVNWNEVLADRMPTTALAIAWYAWMWLPKNAPLLQPPPAGVEALRGWILNAPERVAQEYRGPEVKLDKRHGVDALLALEAGQYPPSPEFDRLYAELTAALQKADDNRCSLCEALLQINFSVMHMHEGSCVGGTWSCACVPPMQSPQ